MVSLKKTSEISIRSFNVFDRSFTKAMTSFLYRYWERIPRMLKWYCTIAVVVLIGITSLGIYGFLSDAYDDTRSRVEMHESNIETLNKEIDKKIADLVLDDDMLAKSHNEIDAGSQRIGNFADEITNGG